jgi:hypothetical protein
MNSSKKKPTDNPVAPSGSGASLPDNYLDITAAMAGRGVSFKPEDQLIPLITVLQANSPQCNARLPKYVDGAEAGRFWLRNGRDQSRIRAEHVARGAYRVDMISDVPDTV